MQGKQLCRIVRAANSSPLRTFWHFQFPTGLVFSPAFPSITQQCKVQHQRFIQAVALCLNKADLAQPSGTDRRQAFSFGLRRGIVIAVHAQQPPRRLRITQLLLALPCIQRKEPKFIAAFRHFAVELGRPILRADSCFRHLPEGVRRVEEPEAVLPLFQIVSDGFCREMPQLPQLAPSPQRLTSFFQKFWLAFYIHAGKHGKQHRQQQPQHGGILCRHLTRKIHIVLRRHQRLGQGHLLHRIVLQPYPYPRFGQQVKFDLLHPSPPSDIPDHSRGHSKAPCPQDGRSGLHPTAGPALRAAAATAATLQAICGRLRPAPG